MRFFNAGKDCTAAATFSSSPDVVGQFLNPRVSHGGIVTTIYANHVNILT